MIAENGAAAAILSCADTTAVRFLHYSNALQNVQENTNIFVDFLRFMAMMTFDSCIICTKSGSAV
jgi:hypothetical protein